MQNDCLADFLKEVESIQVSKKASIGSAEKATAELVKQTWSGDWNDNEVKALCQSDSTNARNHLDMVAKPSCFYCYSAVDTTRARAQENSDNHKLQNNYFGNPSHAKIMKHWKACKEVYGRLHGDLAMHSSNIYRTIIHEMHQFFETKQ